MRRPGIVLVAAVAVALSAGIAAPADAASCAIGSLASDSRLAHFEGYVAASDGSTLYSKRGTTPASTGSVLKLLTAAVALDVLGPNRRLTTKVVSGTKPGTIVLVGGGDPTLSRVSNGYYPGAPRLAALAAKVKKARHGAKVTKIVVDSSLWSSADAWDRTWKRSEQRTGYLSEVSPLQVDGDRANPRATVSHRSTDPAKKAGRYFAKALGVPHVKVVKGRAPSRAPLLGAVKSQPVKKLVRFMLLTSDGTLGEVLARDASLAAGADGSRASLQSVYAASLARYGLAPSKLTIHDGSGLSTSNAVSPKFVTQLLRAIDRGKGHLEWADAGLSIAGRTGSLPSRFTASPARGRIAAKTGWLDTEYSLAGVVRAKDGSRETFAFYAIGAHIRPSAKQALDALATRVYVCGARLS